MLVFARSLFAAFSLVAALPAIGQAADVHVFAAASLKNALETVASQWEDATGNKVLLTFASSSAIARQIEQGAPADIFISADLKWMDYLEDAGEIRSESRVNLLGNKLVLIGARDDDRTIDISGKSDLAAELDGGRLALGATTSVPAGRYAKAALTALGLWAGVKDHLAEAENVRAALALVSRGEAPLGIVYSTDAKVEEGVKVLATFPEGSHLPIIYPAAIVKSSSSNDAGEFFGYMQSRSAGDAFAAAGFTVLTPQTSN